MRENSEIRDGSALAAETMPDDVQAFMEAAASDNGSVPEFALLKVWLEVLGNIEQALETRLSMSAIHGIVRAWPELRVQEAMTYHYNYHSNLLVMRRILEAIIAQDDECLSREGADDIEESRDLYLQLLTEWQRQMVRWEKTWDPGDEDAHIWMAAYLSVGEFFFGEQGLVRHLDLRGFKLTDDEAAAIWLEAQEV